MQLPVRFAVRLPDGSEHTVSSLIMKRDGTVVRIDTHSEDGKAFGPFYTIEGDDLGKVTLITYHKSEGW
jgi:glycerate kinase